LFSGLAWINNERPDVPLGKKQSKLDAISPVTRETNNMPHIVFFLIDDQGFDDMGYQTTS
ncbi:unnamed protein product, partial [Heterosigma akashiwo]